MKRKLLCTLTLLLSGIAVADPVELILTAKIESIKDAKTGQGYVLKGNKARVYSKIAVHAKGFANRGLKQWMEKALPTVLEGFFEREDRDTGLSVRYRAVPFQLKKRDIFCTAGSSTEHEVCHADYAVSSANAVDIPAGEGGEHAVMLQVLPLNNGLKPKMAKNPSKSFVVLSGEPTLSRYSITGMPEY